MSDHARAVVSAGVAAAVFVGAVAAVAVLGRSSPPQLPSLADQPVSDLHGQIAYVVAGDGDQTCAAIVDLADGSREVRGCVDARLHGATLADDGRTVEAVGSHPGGTLVVTFDGDGRIRERVVDPAEPADIDDPLRSRRAESADGRRAIISGFGHDPAEIAVVSADGRVLAERRFEGGRGYGVTDVGWITDDEWLVLRDTAGRLVVIDASLRRARVAADDVLSP